MLAHLFPLADGDPFLHPREVAKRITASFPNSIVDWDRANRKLQSELVRLVEAGTPEPVISGHKNLFNNTAYIEVGQLNGSGNGLRFFAYLDSPIDVEFIEPHNGNEEQTVQDRRLVAEIAKCLNYDVEFEM
jgi:hypothetical protein